MIDQNLQLMKPPKDFFGMQVTVKNSSSTLYKNLNATIECDRTMGGMSLLNN